MLRGFYFFMVTVALTLPFKAHAQLGMVELDLATPLTLQPVVAGDIIKIRIENRIPGVKYQIQIERHTLEIPPLAAPRRTRGAISCSNLAEEFEITATNAQSEQAVAQVIREFRTEASSCTPEEKAALDGNIERLTVFDLGSYRLRKGEQQVIKVQRDDQNWEFTLSTGERGQWRTFYGFLFLPNEDEQFYTKQDPANANQFIIMEEKDREQLDFAPSVLFVWSPESWEGRSWSHGLTAGLGFDMDDPIVFAGYALTFNENVAITVGAAFCKREQLAGRYQTGEIVGEDLDSSQLTEETYGINGYLGVAFRFGSSPFSQDN